MKDRPGKLLLTAVITLGSVLALLLSASCSSITYYGQAVNGHFSLMHQRQDVNKLLDDPETEAGLAADLRLSQEILRFAETDLLLDAHGSYQHLVITGQPAVIWNVVLAEEFSVEAKTWCFPVAGCVPYRGYYQREKAVEFTRQPRAEGWDVDLSPVMAYSTLGWFNDPLLDTMFQDSPSQLAAVLIHELAHQKLYLAGDTSFNESFAEFVESLGVEQWLRQTERWQELQAWKQRRKAEPQFVALLAETRETLKQLYASSLELAELRVKKQAYLAAMHSEYQRLVREEWQDRDYFGGWMEGELNNAKLALAESYIGGSCAFESLYQKAGGDLAGFYALAEQMANLGQVQRDAWLQAPCEHPQ